MTATFRDVSKKSSGTIGGKVGYWFNNLHELGALGIGLDIFSFGADIAQQTVPVSPGSGTGTLRPINTSIIGVGFDVVKVRLHLNKSEAFPQGQFQPMVSIGPAIFRASVEDTNNFTPQNQSPHHTTIGVKVGVGAHYVVNQYISVFGEYRFTHFGTEVSFTQLNTTQTVNTTLNTNHLVGGVSVHF